MKQYPEQNRDFHYEWSKLDTTDQLTNYYKHLRTPEQIRKTLEKLQAKKIWINEDGKWG